MRVHVVYRVAGAENLRGRPPFYSKLLSLQSLLRAREECDAPIDVVFLADGPLPQELQRWMSSAGEVVPLRRGSGMYRSYLEALALPGNRGWPDEDLVYFVEDDYLHRPAALQRLAEAAQALPEAAYLGLYAQFDWRRTRRLDVGDCVWHIAHSTTSTFATRIGTLREDRWIHRLGFVAESSPDTDVCSTYRGVRPFRWDYLIGDLAGLEPGGAWPPRRRLKRAAGQAALNLLAVKAGFRRRLLVSAYPSLATHLAVPYLAPEVDWEAVAAETSGWAEARGLGEARA